MKSIQKLKPIVAAHPAGHLPLKYRAQLARRAGDPRTVGKIYFECVKKVFPVWEEEYPGDTTVCEMLKKAHEFLYLNKGNGKDFVKLADRHKNHIEAIDSEAGAAGLAALYLCYSLGAAASENDADDDDALDYEDWPPDFYASLAWSGGNPFGGTGDAEKRRAFWIWYLDMAEVLLAAPQTPLLPVPTPLPVTESQEEFVRKQTPKTAVVGEHIQKSIEAAAEVLAEKNAAWDEFRVTMYDIDGINYTMSVVKNNEEIKIKPQMMDFQHEIADHLSNVKKEMYRQIPKEGAWCVCYLHAHKNRSYEISFNYDDKDGFPERGLRPDELVYEFKKYPRAREFTPRWWQKVLGKKAKYLE